LGNNKVVTVNSWPVPCSTHGLSGFRGLAGYYQKFIHDFGTVAAPLMWLLCKDAFSWMDEADTVFQTLKRVLSMGPVLQMPIFDCDSSGTRFGAILHQDVGPFAIFSHPFAMRHLKLVAYKCELIGLVQAMRH
jgi:hypothetical protein